MDAGDRRDLRCLELESGQLVWSRDFKKDFAIKTPEWGFAGHPLLDGNRLICLVGGPGSVAVAFDKDTGKELWRALTAKEPGYSPPTMIEAGGRRELVVWHPEAVNGLDPGRARFAGRSPGRSGSASRRHSRGGTVTGSF